MSIYLLLGLQSSPFRDIWYTYGKYKRPRKTSLSGADNGDLKIPRPIDLVMLEPSKVDVFISVYLISVCAYLYLQ